MDIEQYKKIVDKHTPKEPKGKNVLVAFLSGGLIGVIG